MKHTANRILLVLLLVTGLAHAEMPLAVETPYAEALVAYHSGSYNVAIRLLDRIQANGDDQIKVWELRALALQASGQLQEALEVYRVLLQSVSERSRPAAQSAVYDFQAGLILFQKKRYLEARLHLERALDHKYNAVFANFLLGRACYELGDYRAASIYLETTLESNDEDLKPSAGYYLGLLQMRQQQQDQAVEVWKGAREQIDRRLSGTDLTPELRGSFTKTAEALDAVLNGELTGHFDGRLGFVTAYDSNIALLNANDEANIGQLTFLELFRYGLSYTTSPDSTFQLTPYLRGFTNFNTNGGTSPAQYLNQQVGLIITADPLSASPFGLELNGAYLSRYSSATSSFPTELFAATATIFLQDEGAKGELWDFRISAAYDDFTLDNELPPGLAMTGEDYSARVSYRKENHRIWWNPGFEAAIYYQDTQGTEYQGIGAEILVENTLEIDRRWKLIPEFGLGLVEYPNSSQSSRTDTPFRLGYDLRFQWSEALRLSTQLSYLDNLSSNYNLYQYDRLWATLCVDYFF